MDTGSFHYLLILFRTSPKLYPKGFEGRLRILFSFKITLCFSSCNLSLYQKRQIDADACQDLT